MEEQHVQSRENIFLITKIKEMGLKIIDNHTLNEHEKKQTEGNVYIVKKTEKKTEDLHSGLTGN